MSKIIKNYKDIKYGPAPEDDKEVVLWIKKLSSPNRNYIDGKWTPSQNTNASDYKKNKLFYILKIQKHCR